MSVLRRAPVVVLLALAALPAVTGPSSSAAAPHEASRGAVYVSVNAGGSDLERRPAAMHLVSNENLHGIRWSSWGGPAATGRATSYANAPSPGHRARNPVRVRLSGRRTCGGVRVYTVVRLHFTRGVPYAGQPRVERIPFGCPPSS